jgi:RNA recognition motif-containing protein
MLKNFSENDVDFDPEEY